MHYTLIYFINKNLDFVVNESLTITCRM